jgi:hypothetical protein
LGFIGREGRPIDVAHTNPLTGPEFLQKDLTAVVKTQAIPICELVRGHLDENRILALCKPEPLAGVRSTVSIRTAAPGGMQTAVGPLCRLGRNQDWSCGPIPIQVFISFASEKSSAPTKPVHPVEKR